MRRAVAGAAAVFLLSPSAHANDRDVRALTIPAASCVDIGAPSGATWIREGALVISGAAEAHLRCGLPINNIELSGKTNDNDITEFETFTFDKDGQGKDANVDVELIRTSTDIHGGKGISGTVICAWSSSSVTGTAFWLRLRARCVTDISPINSYYFAVTLTSTIGGPEMTAGFAGIRFP